MARLHIPQPKAVRDWLLSLTIRSNARSLRQRSVKNAPIIIGLALVVLTSAFGSKYYNEPKLTAGTIAPETLVASTTKTFVDELRTEQKRLDERNKVLGQYQLNSAATLMIQEQLSDVLAEASTLRQLAGSFPFLGTNRLTVSAQQELRQLESSTLESLFLALKVESPSRTTALNSISESTWEQLIALQSKTLEQDKSWDAVTQKIRDAHRRYQTALQTSTSLIQKNNQVKILALRDADWKMVKPNFQAATQRILTQGIPEGLSNKILASALRANLSNTPPSVQTLGQALILPILKPNLEIDQFMTERRQEQVAAKVTPVQITVQKDEVIVRKNQVITPAQFQILEKYNLSRRGLNWQGLGITVLGVSIAIALFNVVRQRISIPLARRDYLLLMILSASAPFVAGISQLEFTSLPAVGLLVGSLYGSILGGTVIVLITGLMALGLNTGFAQLFAIAIGSFIGSVLARQPRSREELALLGLIVAVLQGLLYFVFLILSGNVWYLIIGQAVRQGVLGLIWSVATLGISPYLENLFDLVTPIRLAELANPNRPLLKRLAMETPGTFQHTLFVATLAEAGGRALGCNVELIRTGTLYHDIGKMHYPDAFIENQFGGVNLHEEMDDPWESAKIIKKHVSEGLVMARKYHLPSAVTAFIPEHQGSILVAYFYHQAKQRTVTPSQLQVKEDAEDSVDPTAVVLEADFRYDGPIPQTKETGIVMLADACEAALRSLKDASAELANRTVNKIFKARWEDQQLAESSLTRDDLKILAQVFVEVWQQFHHQRIAYPKRLNTRH